VFSALALPASARAVPALAAPALAAQAQAQAQAVVRPEPGLARGVWEAPPWVFVALLAAAAVAALAWAATALLKRTATR
jgi:hypothetical protein